MRASFEGDNKPVIWGDLIHFLREQRSSEPQPATPVCKASQFEPVLQFGSWAVCRVASRKSDARPNAPLQSPDKEQVISACVRSV